MNFETTHGNSGPPKRAFADSPLERRHVLLHKAVLAPPRRGVPINHVARGVLREQGVTAGRIERVASLSGAESQRLELNGGATSAT